jgi:hypothetical protein
MADAAAVLKHSIHLNSYPQNTNSSYNYKMIAFVHPEAMGCIHPFQKLGYEIQIKETPIDPTKIKGDFLREKVDKTGCCGAKEFLKLYAYTLVEYEIVVHLDLDSLILQPLDNLFDSMLLDNEAKAVSDSKLPVMFGDPVPEKIEAFFTRDYNMANLGKKHVNMQGGFFVVKPNLQYFEEYKEAILEGDFIPGNGWKGKYGGYFGAQQIQGLCAYFFDGLHPGTAVELNRCIYNNMNDDPKREKGKTGEKVCMDGKETCEDCREADIANVKSAHFTICQKPWICPHYTLQIPLCKEFHKKWFTIRRDLERQLDIEKIDEVDSSVDPFNGYCRSGKSGKGYAPLLI